MKTDAIPLRGIASGCFWIAAKVSGVDRRHLHLGVLLAVPLGVPVALPPLVVEADDLRALDIPEDVDADGRAGHQWLPDLDVAGAADEQDAVELQVLGAFLDLAVDEQGVAGGHFELLATLFDDRVHVGSAGLSLSG